MRSLFLLLGLMLLPSPGDAADHGDSPAVAVDPASDIADLFAWTSVDGTRLNLVMTFPAATFSDTTQYVFHVGSGAALGVTTANYSVLCRFDATQQIECWAGDDDDYVRADASNVEGVDGMNNRFTVFAGLRNDPFFFNINGFLAVLDAAKMGVDTGGISLDVALCPIVDAPTSAVLVTQLRTEPDGSPPTDEFANNDVAALVVSIDLDLVNAGGDVLAVWGATYVP